MSKGLKPRQQRLVTVVVSSLLVLAACSWLVRLQPGLVGVERVLFEAVYGLPDWLHLAFLLITQLGGVWLMVGVVLGLSLRRYYAVAVRLALAVGAATTLTVIIKGLATRPRPFELLSTVLSRDISIAGYGFPSSHAAIAASAAYVLIHYAPQNLRAWIVGAASLVALSRVFLGVHSPLDVVAGAAVGTLTAALTLLIPRIPINFFKK